MPLTFDREAVVNIIAGREQLEEWLPRIGAFLARQKRLGIADDDDRCPRARQKDVQAFFRCHETNVAILVAASQTGDDNFTFFALVVV